MCILHVGVCHIPYGEHLHVYQLCYDRLNLSFFYHVAYMQVRKKSSVYTFQLVSFAL